jgi:hypothetical protein
MKEKNKRDMESLQQVQRIFAELEKDIRTQYLVTYRPTQPNAVEIKYSQ